MLELAIECRRMTRLLDEEIDNLWHNNDAYEGAVELASIYARAAVRALDREAFGDYEDLAFDLTHLITVSDEIIGSIPNDEINERIRAFIDLCESQLPKEA